MKTFIIIVITFMVHLMILLFALTYRNIEREKEIGSAGKKLGEDTYRCAILEYNIQFKDSIDFIRIDSIADRINFKNGF